MDAHFSILDNMLGLGTSGRAVGPGPLGTVADVLDDVENALGALFALSRAYPAMVRATGDEMRLPKAGSRTIRAVAAALPSVLPGVAH